MKLRLVNKMEKAKILVVDDESRMRKLVSDFLHHEGYTVVEAEDGEKAVDIFFEDSSIELIILDVMMPKMDGYEVCRKIRAKSNVPIILVTARGEGFEKIMGLDIGADDYIVKPFSPSEVMARLRAVLRRMVAPESSANVANENFIKIDQVKRQIIALYEDDFKKIDSSGRISAMYHAIPAQLSKDLRKYRITSAIGKRNQTKMEELLHEMIDSKTVLPCYNATNPRVSLSNTKDFSSYKLYLSDTGLFVTLMFIDRKETENEIYGKLLSDKLPANLGYLYENLVAQMINAAGRELYYHTWEKKGSTHYYEVDFLISKNSKVSAFEVKSSGTGKHESINKFYKKFSANTDNIYLLSQKDTVTEEMLKKSPIYLTPFLVE